MHPLNRIPLPALRATEAVARLGSLAAAAEELGVTPGAVSQQVIRAEKILNLTLFDRRPSGMVPTAKGREVTALLSDGFARLTAAVQRAGRGDDALTVSVAPVFAARWLIWRLPKFSAAHPGIRVRLDASLALVNPSAGEVDLCIRVGRGGWPGVKAERFFSQIVFPVCAPALAPVLRSPADLPKLPAIREPNPTFDWPDWLGPEGYPDVVPGDGPVFSDASLCLDAAISGAGVFLTFETLAADALAAGRIVEPFGGRHATRNAYWIVTPQTGAPGRAVRAFIRWLRAEVSEAGFGQERALSFRP